VLLKSDFLILTAAFLSLLLSISLWFGFAVPASREAGIFVGIWVPSIISTGVYFKLAARRP
jgi:hypothetical protein